MVPERGEDGHSGEHVGHLRHRLLQHLEVLLLGLVPHVVRRQVARPQDVVYVLEFVGKKLIEKIKIGSLFTHH